MTWWQKLFEGFNTTDNKEEIDPLTGGVDSPKFVEYLKGQGYYFDRGRCWWKRVWTTSTPSYQYPELKKVFEVFEFDSVRKKWMYRIVDPEFLGGLGGGGNGNGWIIWEDTDLGEKE